jgi:CRP-like cAMP-binding protein
LVDQLIKLVVLVIMHKPRQRRLVHLLQHVAEPFLRRTAFGKMLAVDLAQGAHERVAVLFAEFPVSVPVATMQARFYVPGDIPDLLSLHIDVMDHSLATIVASKVAFIPHDPLRRLIDQNPRVANAFWRDTLVDAALFREWIVNLGTRDAYSRIGHLICEVFLKLKAVGLTNGNSFDFPITQGEIGDATGLSTVHVNRSIMELRKDGLIVLEKGRCTIIDLTRLKEAAKFDPTYLHLTGERRSGKAPLAQDQRSIAN